VVNGMILAAGFGTRLAPLTDALPKALVPVSGRPMIEHVIDALIDAGCTRIVVNCHHQAERMHEHFAHGSYDAEVILVDEVDILGTGGGILHARSLLDGEEPFLVHNADIVSGFDLRALLRTHTETGAIATLAIQRRPTSRAVLFDAVLRFLGKEAWSAEGITFPSDSQRYAFCGIHAISPDIFRIGFPDGYSDIFDVYRSALSQGKRINGLPFGEEPWHDLGSMEKIRAYENSRPLR
jgi:N-acetyl-alpha-D-muramate 1-phosphate uridylyltransferase